MNRIQDISKKLSIIVPAYNEEKTIIGLLEKVANVALDGFQKEIIVVNDCSGDATEKLVLEYQSQNAVSYQRNSTWNVHEPSGV